MIISHSHKFIFVCPRKVASTSVRISLSRSCSEDDVIVGDDVFSRDTDGTDFGVLSTRNATAFPSFTKHTLPSNIRENIGARIWDEYFKFTVVRNPWDLLVSFVYFRFGPGWHDTPSWKLYRFRHLHALYQLFYRQRARQDFKRGRHKDSVDLILKKNLLPNIAQIPEFYFIDCKGTVGLGGVGVGVDLLGGQGVAGNLGLVWVCAPLRSQAPPAAAVDSWFALRARPAQKRLTRSFPICCAPLGKLPADAVRCR